jgi:hypothetical protein
MKKVLFLVLLLLTLTPFSFAQSTLVSATITDQGGQAWLNGTYKFTFVPVFGNAGPYVWTGGAFSLGTTVSGSLDGTGSFTSVSVPSNTAITPSGTQWKVQVCPMGSGACFATNLTITGATQSLTSSVIPPAISVPPTGATQTVAYADSEITGAVEGSSYFNFINGGTRQFHNGAWVAAGGSGISSNVPVTCAASLTFTVTTSFITDFVLPLTCSVTSSVMAGPFTCPANGQCTEAAFAITQDSVGNRPFVWPINFVNAPSISLWPGSSTNVTFQYCGTVGNGNACPANSWINTAAGDSGAGGPAAWQRIGPVIYAGGSSPTSVSEPNAFFPPTAVVMTNLGTGVPVLGMIHTLGYTTCQLVYKESIDGITWFAGAGNIAGHCHSGISVIGGTIYITAANASTGANGIDLYSGTSWSNLALVKANIAVSGSGPAWKSTSLANSVLQNFGGTWYLFYEASNGSRWSIGVATCTTPGGAMVCTDSGSNPILVNPTSTGTFSDIKSIRQITSTSFITWWHGTPSGITGTLPSDIYFASCSGVGCPITGWTISTNAVIYRSTAVSGVNSANGQIADFSPITFNGNCYGYDGSFPDGNNGLWGAIELSIANIPCEQFTAGTPQTIAAPPRAPNYGTPAQNATTSGALVSGTITNVAGITLEPGTWDISGACLFTAGAATTVTASNCHVSPSSSANTLTDSTNPEAAAFNAWPSAGTALAASAQWSANTGTYTAVITIAGTALFINAQCSFTGNAPTATGSYKVKRIN